MRSSITADHDSKSRVLRRSSGAVAALAVGLLIWGCDDDTRPGPPGTASPTASGTGSGTGTAGTGGGATGGGGVGGGMGGGAQGGGGEGGDGAGGSGELGPIAHEDVPDTPCVAPGGTPVKLYDSGPGGPAFPRLVSVGSRRAAGEDGTWKGFVTFDAAGTNPDATATTVGDWDQRLGSEGTTLALAANTGTGDTVYQRFDDTGALVGSELTVAVGDASARLQLASGEGESLVVWGTDSGTIRARGIDGSGALAGGAFDIDTGAFSTTLTTVATRRPGGFAVAYSGDVVHASEYAITFATTSLTGVAAGPVEITRTDVSPQLVRMVKTPSGYALLLGGPITASPYVLILDEAGSLVGPAHRLVGAIDGWDIAAQGAEIGVLAPRATAEPEFRPFDATMNPLGPWVCLDGPAAITLYGGLDVDGAGYAAVYFRATTLPQGEQMYVQLDRLGTGP